MVSGITDNVPCFSYYHYCSLLTPDAHCLDSAPLSKVAVFRTIRQLMRMNRIPRFTPQQIKDACLRIGSARIDKVFNAIKSGSEWPLKRKDTFSIAEKKARQRCKYIGKLLTLIITESTYQ
jgi:hypothetical protein